MKHKELIKETIKSFCKKHNLTIKEDCIYFNDLCIFEIPLTEFREDTIYNDFTLSFLRGFDCAKDINEGYKRRFVCKYCGKEREGFCPECKGD